MKAENVNLLRALTEIRYDRSFLYDDLKMLNQISKGLKGTFGQSQKDEQNNALIFINPEKQIFSIIRPDTANIDMQKPSSFNDFQEVATKVIEEVSNNLDVEEFTRMGMRLFFGKPIPSLIEGQEIIREKFFTKFQNSLETEIRNPQLTFNFQKDDDYIVNVAIRAETNTSFQITPNEVNHSNDSFIVIDLDVYTNASNSFGNFFNTANDISISTLNQILELLEV